MRPLLVCTLSLLMACDGGDPATDTGGPGDTEDTQPTETDDGSSDDTDTDVASDTDGGDTDATDTDLPDLELVTAVRFLSLIQTAGNVDVYLDDATTPEVSNLAYRTPSDFVELAAGDYTLNVRLAGSPATAAPVASLPISLAPEKNLLAVAHPNIEQAGGTPGGPPIFTDVIDLTATPGRISARMGFMFYTGTFDRSIATNGLAMWAPSKPRPGLIGAVHELPNEGGYIGLSSDYEANVTGNILTSDLADAAVMIFPGISPGEPTLAVHSFGDDELTQADEEGELLTLNLAYLLTSQFRTHQYQVNAVGENRLGTPPSGTAATNVPLASDLLPGMARGPYTLADGKQWIRVRIEQNNATDFYSIDNASGSRSALILDGREWNEGRIIDLPGAFLRPAPGTMRVSLTGQLSYEDLTVYMTTAGTSQACAGWDDIYLSDSFPVFHSTVDWRPEDLELRMEIDDVFYAFDLDTLAADKLQLLAQRNNTLVAVDEDGTAVLIEGTVSTDPCAP